VILKTAVMWLVRKHIWQTKHEYTEKNGHHFVSPTKLERQIMADAKLRLECPLKVRPAILDFSAYVCVKIHRYLKVIHLHTNLFRVMSQCVSQIPNDSHFGLKHQQYQYNPRPLMSLLTLSLTKPVNPRASCGSIIIPDYQWRKISRISLKYQNCNQSVSHDYGF